MKSIFVTGIGGFIGKRLSERALMRGLTVRGVDHSEAAVAEARRVGIQAELGDISDAARMDELIAGADTVVHTAALVREYGDMELFRRVNVEGSRCVGQAARRAGARSFVHLSSVMVYGFDYSPGVNEEAPTRGEGNPYCQTKIESEAAVLSLGSPPDFGVIVIRPGDVYGPGSVPWIARPVEMMKKRRLFLPMGGRGVINPVYVDNLIDGIFLSLEKRAYGEIFNVTDGHAMAYADFFGRLAERAGLAPPRALPTGLMKALAWSISALRERGLTTDEASVDTVRYLSRPHAYSIEKAERVLGYAPRVPLDEGLALTQPFIDSVMGRRPMTAAQPV